MHPSTGMTRETVTLTCPHWQPWEGETWFYSRIKPLGTHMGKALALALWSWKEPGIGGGHLLTPTSTWSEPRSSCLCSSSK